MQNFAVDLELSRDLLKLFFLVSHGRLEPLYWRFCCWVTIRTSTEPRNSAKQGVETGLSEMVITRETIGELQLLH